MAEVTKDRLAEMLAVNAQLDEALARATREDLLEHARMGRPVCEGRGNGQVSHHERCITLRVLQGVARFVGGDADGGRRLCVVHFAAQPQHPVAGIVMVGEHALRLLDSDIVAAGLIEDVARRRRPAQPGADAHSLRKCAFDLRLCPQH